MEDSLSGHEDTLHLASLHKTDDKLQVVPDPLKDHIYFSFPTTLYEEVVVASSPLLSSPLTSILNPSSQSPITSHIPSLPSRARRRSASSFSTVSAASAPDSAYDSCLESSNDKKCESSMSDDSNVSCNDSFADSFFNFPTTDSTLSSSHESSTNDLTMPQNTASSEIRDADDCQLSTIKDDRRPSTESTESLTTTLDLDLLNSLLTKDILNDMGQVIFNDLEGQGEENYHEVNRPLDDNSAELLNAFDSCDWEETFREFFPELACT